MAEIIAFPVESDLRSTVLVVDDEPAIRAVLCEFLRDSGFRPLAVGSGDAAVAMIEGGAEIDLVFSDVRMPGALDGYGLARWIMENRPDLPIILATGDLGKQNAATELRGAETLAKPYDFNTAARKIRSAIQSHKMQAR